MRPQGRHRPRRGSALVMVLVLTFAMAALALSAIYLSASGATLSRLYERERDFKYAAEAALALGKSRVNRDTTFTLALTDTGYSTLVSGGTITDALGVDVPRVRYDLYVGVTGDTVGIYGQFLTVISRAYDAGGTRHVRRLDLSMESFSKYGMFVDTFPSTLCYGTGEFIRGRAHTNTTWRSCSTSPGPTYFDTVSAVTAVTGTATYSFPSLTGVARIPYPTVTKLAALPTYATSGGLNLTPVSGTSAALTSGGVNVSGGALASPPRGTRIFFDTVDVAGDGTVAQEDGMLMIFDLAAGMDTASLRADVPRSGVTLANVVLQSQCGASFTIGGRREFFTVNRFRERWVRERVRGSTAPLVTNTDTATMGAGTAAAQQLILSYSTARCYPVGDPHLMLAERMISNTCARVTVATTTPVYAWGAQALTCDSAQRYGGQDTTFSPTAFRCMVNQTAASPGSGQCTIPGSTTAATSVIVGSWRTWTGTALPTIAATRIQAVETPYLWPMFKPYNLNSKGVIHFTAGPVYASGIFRGNMTIYVLGRLTFIDDLLYDVDPASTAALCRNFLGVIARDQIMISDNAMNRPRLLPGGGTRFLSPNFHFLLNAVAMSLTGDFGVEGWGNGPSISSGTQATRCGTTLTSGGCINQTGGTINKRFVNATTGGSGFGLLENRSVDPCQLTNRKPPFFPVSGRYLDNKYYEIDPNNIETAADVRTLYQRLRGRIGS